MKRFNSLIEMAEVLGLNDSHVPFEVEVSQEEFDWYIENLPNGGKPRDKTKDWYFRGAKLHVKA